MYKMAVYTSDAKIYQLVEQVMSEIGMRVDIEIQVSHLDEEAFDYQMIFVYTTSGLGLGPIQKCIGQGEGLCPKVIVFTKDRKISIDVAKLLPVGYIQWPCDAEQIRFSFIQSLRINVVQDKILKLRQNRRIRWLLASQLIYIHSDRRKVIYHAKNGEIVCYAKLSAIYRQLPPEDFLVIHKSFVVNIWYIQSIEHEKVVLSGGIELPISATYRRFVHVVWNRQRQLLIESTSGSS